MYRLTVATLFAGILACGEGTAVGPEPPPPPPVATLNGTWEFRMTVTTTDPLCQYWLGRNYAHTIEISQAGSTVIAEGFMDLAQNELVGTVNSERRVILSGDYPEEGFMTTIILQLSWDGEVTLTGTGTWEWTGRDRQCDRGNLSVLATRVD